MTLRLLPCLWVSALLILYSAAALYEYGVPQ